MAHRGEILWYRPHNLIINHGQARLTRVREEGARERGRQVDDDDFSAETVSTVRTSDASRLEYVAAGLQHTLENSRSRIEERDSQCLRSIEAPICFILLAALSSLKKLSPYSVCVHRALKE